MISVQIPKAGLLDREAGGPLPLAGLAEDQSVAANVVWRAERAVIIRNAVGIGIASGAYAVSFGAIATTSGLSVLQTSFLSLILFSGASQFALVGILAGRGGALAAAGTAILLGGRNALYGLRLSPVLQLRAFRRLIGAQFVIDETTAMAILHDDPKTARFAFWVTAASMYSLWNVGTLIGAVGATAIANPRIYGLDVAAPAAFLALLAPRMRTRSSWVVAVAGAATAMVATPFVPAGVPVLLAGVAAAGAGLASLERRAGRLDSVTGELE